MSFSKFAASAQQSSFGANITKFKVESPKSSSSQEEDNGPEPMVPLKQSKSDIPTHTQNNSRLKPKLPLEKAVSASSQQSNASSGRFNPIEEEEEEKAKDALI